MSSKYEEFNPYHFDARPIPPPRFRLVKRGLCFHLMGWPALVIFSQLFLQGLGWTFLAVVKSRQYVALPVSSALWAEKNPRLLTLGATLFATLLAGISSFIFSYALRRSMSLYLLRPVSLAALAASVNISMRSVVFHRRHWKWPIVSLLFFIMVGIQTSVWSTLITPVKIAISTPLVGREIDLASPNLEQMSDHLRDKCFLAGKDGAVYGGVPGSGYAKGQSYIGLPAAVSLLGKGFNVSTQGIEAATMEDNDVGSWLIPATTEVVGTRPKGIADSYSMTQQGFSADISCTQRTLTTQTSPDVMLATDFVTGWNNAPSRNYALANITWVSAMSFCAAKPSPGMNMTDAYVDAGKPYMWALVCDPISTAPNNYTLILQGRVNYTDLTGTSEDSYLVCQIAPKTTIVQAGYYAGDINFNLTSESLANLPAGGPAGFFAMYIVTDLVWHSQGNANNAMADQLVVLLENIETDQSKIVEEYLKGVIEYSASIFRACLSAKDLTFAGGVPTNITQATSGTWETQTMGWKPFSSATTLWVLIPGIFMACSTLGVVLIALYRHRGDMHHDTHSFDPSNPLHLMAVAAAGGLNNVFRGFGEEDINEGGKLPVVLGSVPGRGPALIRADEYTPVFVDTLSSRPVSATL
ncbi:hypothetical protein C8R43DRAFT_1112472 [Mycena crocata]|nr:hypothetical protein C8R43DRAFT_1112472 [Mycena crocata]